MTVSGVPVTSAGSGVSGGSATSCESFKQVNGRVSAQSDAGCTACGNSNLPAAIDGDLATHADLTVNNASAGVGASIRATAQPGIIFAAGKTAGAFYSVPAGTGQSYTVTVRTLAGGVVQESNASDNSGGLSGVTGGHGSSFTGIHTSKPFDAVEVFVSNTQVGGTPTFSVYEFCSDHQ